MGTVSRPRSNTPLQSLVLLNDPIYVEAARKFAQRLLASDADSPEQRLLAAFDLALQRKPTRAEQRVLLDLHAKHLERYRCGLSLPIIFYKLHFPNCIFNYLV